MKCTPVGTLVSPCRTRPRYFTGHCMEMCNLEDCLAHCFVCKIWLGYWLYAQLYKLWTSLVSLGKLEEEFERKFNSLPQYSPMIFDKKGAAVTKKKKTDSSIVQEEVSKAGKGKTKLKISTLNKHNDCFIRAPHLIHAPPCTCLHVFHTSEPVLSL